MTIRIDPQQARHQPAVEVHRRQKEKVESASRVKLFSVGGRHTRALPS